MSWFWLLRPWSYAATLVPFLLGAGLCAGRGTLMWANWSVGLRSGRFLQATGNLLNTWGTSIPVRLYGYGFNLNPLPYCVRWWIFARSPSILNIFPVVSKGYLYREPVFPNLNNLFRPDAVI